MIINALYKYYEREIAKKDSLLPAFGFELKEIKFIIEITKDGRFSRLLDMREGKIGKEYLVPRSSGRSGINSSQTAFLLWDNTGYVLGKPESDSEKHINQAKCQNESFVKRIHDLPDDVKADEGVSAVIRFYEQNGSLEVMKASNWEVCAAINGCNVTFQLVDGSEPVFSSPVVKDFISTTSSDQDKEDFRICSVTGKKGVIAKTHTATPIFGNKPAGAGKLVSFQKSKGYDSYGKEQGDNAPVNVQVEFGYTTALKYLLNSERNHVRLGRLTVVFWTEKEIDGFEDAFKGVCEELPNDNDDGSLDEEKGFFESVTSGRPQEELESRVYVLGLEPNAARLVVKIWETGTLKDFAEKITLHYDDMKLVHGPKDSDYLSLSSILRATALDYKMDNVLPSLKVGVFQSILTGAAYPLALFRQAMIRIRAEQNPSYRRVAILKACLNRWARKGIFNAERVESMLDEDNKNSAYLLGRAFAILEYAQKEAFPKRNATIKDRMFRSAATTPLAVFPKTIKLFDHNLKHIDNEGKARWIDRLLTETMAQVHPIPAFLTEFEQGEFISGYFVQKQNFYTKKESANKGEENVD
ncbi:MAG: type I-C CRISPR-associated protein Cas8c/Csd1 [Raoultibacter sp.]|jgi:CRISPR-associated protein Csd1